MTDNPNKAAIWAGDWSASANKPYRPSNGSEGRIFENMWCANCARDRAFREAWARNEDADGCPILADALCLDLGEEGYPVEWRHDAAGVPECTAWEPIGAVSEASAQTTDADRKTNNNPSLSKPNQ